MGSRTPRLTEDQIKEVNKNVGQLDVQEKKESNFISDNIDIAEAVEKEILREDDDKKDGSADAKKETGRDAKKQVSKKKLAIVFALILIGIFLGSYFYSGWHDNDPNGKHIQEVNRFIYYYDDFEFRQNKDGTWATEVYNPLLQTIYVVALHYGPRDLEDIPMYGKDVRDWLEYSGLFTANKNGTVGAGYVLFDPEVDGAIHALAYNELVRNMNSGLKMAMHPAITQNISENNLDIPVKSCKDTKEPIIWLRHQEPAMIEYAEDHCIIVQGSGEDLVRAENKLLWMFYSVMEHRKAFIGQD